MAARAWQHGIPMMLHFLHVHDASSILTTNFSPTCDASLTSKILSADNYVKFNNRQRTLDNAYLIKRYKWKYGTLDDALLDKCCLNGYP